MNLGMVALQLQGITDSVSSFFNFNDPEGGLPIVTNVVPFIILGIFAVIGYLAWRYRTNMQQYPNPESRVSKVTFLWQGQYEFTGNVSRLRVPLTKKVFDELNQEKKFRGGLKELEDLVRKKLVFLYEMNLTEWNDALNLKKSKESAIIISPVDIASDKYSWEDTKEKFSISTMTYEQNRYCMVSENSAKFEVITLDEILREIFVIAPIPRYTEKVTELLNIKSLDLELKEDTTGINIIQLPNMSAFAELVPKMVGMAKATSMIKTRNMSINNLNEVIKEKDDSIAELTEELSTARAIASSTPLIGEINPKKPDKYVAPLVWFVIFAISALGGTKLPTLTPELANVDPMVGGILGMVVAFAMWNFFGKPKDDGIEIKSETQ